MLFYLRRGFSRSQSERRGTVELSIANLETEILRYSFDLFDTLPKSLDVS